MSGTSRGFFKASAAALCLSFVGLISLAANAASINYGSFGPVPPGVSFLGVTESSGTDAVPLYGPPTPYSVGLNFNPVSFTSTASGGAVDITDGQLNFTIASAPQVGINSFNVFEAGDYTLLGAAGTFATQAGAGAILRATVTGINGGPVAPINLAPVNASFSDALPGQVIVGPWSLGATLNIGAQLANLGIAGRATRVDVVINNQLFTTSEPGTASFIAKKEFIVDVKTSVPEPTSVALAGVALCGLGFAGRKRS